MIAIVLLITAPACSGGGGGQDKAGGPGAPVVLTMANIAANMDYWPALQLFAQRLEQISDGALRVEIENEWVGWSDDLEAQVVRDTAEGEADLSWVGTRSLSSSGVTAFEALSAPLLIDSYELQSEVLGSELPGEMLPALEPLGVTGLAVLAGPFFKPVAVQRPFVRAADWRGKTFQMRRSATNQLIADSLGAGLSEVVGDDRDRALDDGHLDGFAYTLLGYEINGYHTRAPNVTVNVNLWPDTVVLFVGTERWESLSQEQRDWITSAAEEATQQSVELADDEESVGQDLCSGFGVRLAHATPGALAELRGALQPVYDRLAQDTATKEHLRRIEEMKDSTQAPPATVDACEDDLRVTEQEADPLAASELNGTYRWTLTKADAQRAFPDALPSDFDKYPNTYTMTLRHGAWSGTESSYPEEDGAGHYWVRGDRISFSTLDDPSAATFTFSVNDHGDLRLRALQAPDDLAFVTTTHPWIRIE